MNDESNLDQGVEKAQPLEEEEIIELTDEVLEASEEGAGDNTVQVEEDIIELLDVEDKSEQIDDDLKTSIGISNALSPEHLEEALERVVEKMFSEKIEKMLAEMIESAVSKEIKSIKERLLDDESPDSINV